VAALVLSRDGLSLSAERQSALTARFASYLAAHVKLPADKPQDFLADCR
jgi:hypothetical protein